MGKGDKGAKIFKTKRGRYLLRRERSAAQRSRDQYFCTASRPRAHKRVEAARDGAAVNLRTRAGAASATRSRPAARTSRARTSTASSGGPPGRPRASASAAPCRGAA